MATQCKTVRLLPFQGTYSELPIDRDKRVNKHSDKRAPKVWTFPQNLTIEAKLWKWEQHTSQLVIDVFQINVQLFSEIIRENRPTSQNTTD